jgi:hypothetical protein
MNMTPRLTKVAIALLAGAVLAALLASSSEAAGKRTVRDPKFDNRAVSKNGRLDIVAASHRSKAGTVRFTVTMREKVKRGRSNERPGIFLNTKGGRRSDPEYAAFGQTLFRIRRNGTAVAIGDSALSSARRTWKFAFDPGQVAALADGYGWAAITQKGKRIADIAPDRGYAKGK